MAKAYAPENLRLSVQLSASDFEIMVRGANKLDATPEVQAFIDRAIRNLGKLSERIEQRRAQAPKPVPAVEIPESYARMELTDDLPGDVISMPAGPIPARVDPPLEHPAVTDRTCTITIPTAQKEWLRNDDGGYRCTARMTDGSGSDDVTFVAVKANSAWTCELITPLADGGVIAVRDTSRTKGCSKAVEILAEQTGFEITPIAA
jgi:hypothetical protein